MTAVDHEFVRLRDALARARRERRDVGKRQARLEAYTRSCLATDVGLRRAYAELDASMARVAMDCKTARETLAFGDAR